MNTVPVLKVFLLRPPHPETLGYFISIVAPSLGGKIAPEYLISWSEYGESRFA